MTQKRKEAEHCFLQQSFDCSFCACRKWAGFVFMDKNKFFAA